MTPEWRALANSISVYILRRRLKNEETYMEENKNRFNIYNQFIRDTGTVISDTDLSLWCLDYIQTVSDLPLNVLKRAVEYDKLEY